MRPLTFFLGQTRIEVHGATDGVQAALGAVFATCGQALVPITRGVTYQFDAEGRLSCDGEQVGEGPCEQWGHLAVEGDIYGRLPVWTEPAVTLHAAAVSWAGTPVIMLGDSGVGKSTLARQAVEQGFSYFSDDMTFVDRSRVWGLSRSIQFDPIPIDSEPAPYLDGCDLKSYRYEDKGRRKVCAPLYSVPPDRVARFPARAEGAWLLFLERKASTSLQPLASMDALKRLYESCILGVQSKDSEKFTVVSHLHQYVLYWSDAVEAVGLIKRALS